MIEIVAILKHTANLKIGIPIVQDFGKFELSPIHTINAGFLHRQLGLC